MNKLVTLSLMFVLRFGPGLAIILSTACSTSTSTTKFTPQATQADKARVIFYRPGSMSNALYSPTLFINDTAAPTLKNKKMLSISLTPGKHEFDIDKDNEYMGENKLQLTAIGGRTYYVRVDTSLKLNNATAYKPYERTFTLNQIEERVAIDEISSCCTNKVSLNVMADNDRVKQTQNNEPSFSVDKTHNPFSH